MFSGPLLERLDALLERGERMNSFRFPSRRGAVFQLGEANLGRFREWKNRCLDLIRTAVGEESEFYRAFPVHYPEHRQDTFHVAMEHYLCILRILRERMRERPEEEPPSEDLAPSIVEGARHLLRAGFKDAAAIYCRAALEVSLRELCRGHGVGFEAGDSINKMAQRLMDAKAVSQGEWRAIQAWATFANAAAYQKYDQYKDDQVEDMIDWLQGFTVKTAQTKPVFAADDI